MNSYFKMLFSMVTSQVWFRINDTHTHTQRIVVSFIIEDNVAFNFLLSKHTNAAHFFCASKMFPRIYFIYSPNFLLTFTFFVCLHIW